MIVVRDIFRLKFGKSKEANPLWKQALGILKENGFNARLLTDLAGTPYYTVVLESTYNSLADWENAHNSAGSSAEWKSLYAEIIALTETGHREILSVLA